MRGQVTVAPDAAEETVLAAAKENSNVATYLEGGSVKKVIYVPGRIINLII